MAREGLIAAALFALALGCGGAEPTRGLRDDRGAAPRTPQTAPRITLTEGMRFRVRHRESVESAGRSLLRVASHGYLVVEHVEQDGGARVRVVFARAEHAGEPAAWIVARLQLRPDGRVAHDPAVLCEGDALHLERMVRHLVMPVSMRDQTLESELVEEPVRADVELGRSHGQRAFRARGERSVRGVELGTLHASGRASFSLLATLGDDGLSGRRRLRTRITGRYRDRDTARELEGTLEIESDALVELTTEARDASLPEEAVACERAALAPPEPSERAPGSFDVRIVVQTISIRQGELRACYEAELRRDPSLHGRVRITMTIEESGETTDVAILEDELAGTTVGACIVEVIRTFRFDPAPVEGPVTYQFPFIFEPQTPD